MTVVDNSDSRKSRWNVVDGSPSTEDRRLSLTPGGPRFI